MFSTSAKRVIEQTDPHVNERIRRQTEISLAYFAAHPDQIEQRLRELDEEWDVERALETASSAMSLLGLTMTLFRSRKWVVIPLAVQGFFLQHALQGWCPPLPALRRLGFRTEREIDDERYALRSLRRSARENASR